MRVTMATRVPVRMPAQARREQLLDGPNKREWEDFQVANVSYDHNWKHRLGTIGYEVVCAIGARVERRYTTT